MFSSVFPLCERAVRSRVTLRKEGQVERSGETPKRLSAARSCETYRNVVNAIFRREGGLLFAFYTATRVGFTRSNPSRIRKSPFPVQQTQSAFRPHALRNVFPSWCALAIQIVRPSQSTAETQPKLKPYLLRLSAMISQRFTESSRASIVEKFLSIILSVEA